MTPDGLVTLATDIALVAFLAALALTAIRIVLGPTLADRVLGLDMLVAVAIGFVAAFAIATGQSAYLDIALALGLVGFLATIAFARFIYVSAGQEEGSQTRVREASGEGAGRTGKPDETGEAG